MAYIGREPQIGNYQICDAISVVNGQAAYTMQVSSVNVIPESVNHMIVSLNGVIQKPGSSYTISSSTITFSSNLATGDSIDFIYLLGNTLDLGTPSDSTVTSAKLSGNLVTPGTLDVNGQELILDADADTSITADTDDQIDIKVAGTDQITIKDGAVSPVTDSDVDLGTTSLRFKDTFVDSITVTGEVDAATGDFSGAVDVAGAITSSASATITVADNSDTLTLKSTDADANPGPVLALHRDSSSPADNDVIGRIDFVGENSADEAIDYVSIFAKPSDVTDGTEDFKLIVQGKKAGTDRNLLQVGEDEIVINEDSVDTDFRVESNGQSHMLFVDAGNDRIGILDNAPGHTLESGNSDSGKGWSLANENNVYKIRARSDASDTQTHIQFENTNGTVGTIKTNGTATQFNTSSDYRLKENVSYNFDATTRLKQLKPARFNFKADTDTTVDGFIAHEVSSIVPEAVSGNKDATKTLNNVIKNADGSFFKQNISEEDWIIHKEKGTFANDTTWVATHTMPDYQGIDQSKLVPLLVKTIQELEARITTLENA